MNRIKIGYITCLFMLAEVSASAQTLADFQNTGSDYQICEKIILETDRELYMAGERINIACFTYEPLLQKKISLSKIVYIEFFTTRNLMIEQIKIEMNEGLGSGFIEIPKRLLTGRYYLRAYTNYMKNYGYSGFAYSSVSILNPFLEIDLEEKYNNFTPTLQKCTIYSEGGHIVYGCSNTIVCEFTNNLGSPVASMVRVLDDKDQIITTFTTNAYGLGSFQFTPTPNKQYRVEGAAGASIIEHAIEFPEHAIILKKIHQDREKLQFRILRHDFIDFPVQLELYHSRVSVPLAQITANDSLVSFPLINLPKGIIKFRLRDNSRNILSSRIIYNPPFVNEQFQLKTDKKVYGNRENLTLTIENDSPLCGNELLAVSVFMGAQNNLQDYVRTDIMKYLQSALYPILGGRNYPASEVMYDSVFFEHVMIADRWQDSIPEKHINLNYSELQFFPEIKSDLIFGTLTTEDGTPLSSVPLIQSWIDTVSSMQTTTTIDEGKFYFASNRVGENELIIAHSKYGEGKIAIQDEFYPEFFSLAKEDISVDVAFRNVIQQQMLNLQINDSYIANGLKQNYESALPFYVVPDKIFFIDDYVALPTLEEFLFEVVPGLLPYHSKGKTIIRFPFPQQGVSFGNDPLYIVDGVPVFDADLIADLKCSDLLSVGVIYEKYFYQNETFDGILDIHSLAGNASVLHIPEQVHKAHFVGVQPADDKNFDSIQDENSRTPIFKTQLYWNPSVVLNDSGKVQINFITPDNAGDYIVRCSVKTPDGGIDNYYTTFRVN